MKAVVMAGGEGTRLRPLTSMRPKPMVPIVNQPVMEHIIGLIKHHGMTEVVATLAFMPQVIEDYFGDGDEWDIDISYAIEETPLGTAGSVKNAAEALTETFIVISGDALTDINLTEVIEFHRSRKAAVTIALKRVPDPLEFGVVITDEDGKIERFLEKPSWGQVFSDTINTGIYVVDPLVLDYIPEGTPFDFSSELFPLLMANGHDLYGCVVDGYWCDVGSLESYVDVHRDILDGKAMIFVPGARTKDDVYVGAGADIDPSAEVASKVVIGANTRVRAGAKLGPYTIIGDNCMVGYDAETEHAIVWDDCFIGAHSAVRGAVLCRGVDVRSAAHIEQGVVIGDETMVGHGATIGTDVQVYPFKRIDPGAMVTTSIIWESRAVRSLFGDDGISGLVNIDITPRTHHNDEVSLTLKVEVSSISGTGYADLPTFGSRSVNSVIRLRDGETSILAGLIRDDERTTMESVPGLSDIPLIGRLFARNKSERTETDIVITLTPHIVRVLDVTENDLRPFRVGRDTGSPILDLLEPLRDEPADPTAKPGVKPIIKD